MTDKLKKDIPLTIVDTSSVPEELSGSSEAPELSGNSESSEPTVKAESSEPTVKAEPSDPSEPSGKTAPAAEEPVKPGIALEKAIADQAREDEREGSFNQSLKKILVGEMLNSKFLRENVWVMLIIVFFIVVSITNRYNVQQKLLEQSKLKKELQDTKFRALSAASDLTERTRKSRIIETLQSRQDTTLKEPVHPAFLIEVPQK